MLLATALLIVGLLLVVYSADRLVFAASILCRTFGIPPLIIGMTVVSIGTSLPEIIVSLAASLHEQRDLAVGTALGSNIINILLILGLAVLWLLFIVKLARQAERQGTDSLTREQLAELPRDGGLPVAFLWLGIALIIMPVATRMVVDNATVLANYFAISELTMGLTAIAIGTSLPELATAIAGVRKGENDIAVGNIIGANIFNIVIVLGLPALITPGEIDPLAYSRDYSVMLLVSIIFALLCWRRSPQSGRGVGVLLTGGFIVWLAMLYWLSPILVE
ncbi:calcium/sodium antiporter [Escherichia coli]|nr:calcium/sodium antiporter [Escherichia coli]EFH8624295.1 calcium/sodium antiporter [Escherichia coli]